MDYHKEKVFFNNQSHTSIQDNRKLKWLWSNLYVQQCQSHIIVLLINYFTTYWQYYNMETEKML